MATIWRMEKISWRDTKTNEEVLQLLQEKRSLMDFIWRRKKNWIGHIVRGESLLREDRTIGKRPRSRKRLGMLNEFLKEASYAELKRKVENRKEWRIRKPGTCLTAEHKRRRVQSHTDGYKNYTNKALFRNVYD